MADSALGLAQMPPAYFAMVMATGIVAIACHLEHLSLVPTILLILNLLVYLVLWVLTLIRALRYTGLFLADFSSHQRGPGFFTTVAATSILGSEMVVQLGEPGIAYGLWLLALVLWLLSTYAIFTALTVSREKPSLEQGINGGWLIAVVSTQSLVVLGAMLAPYLEIQGEALMFSLMALWLAGGMLYIWMISLIFYRYTFLQVRPRDLTPPYWINMGAMAISTLAGTVLIQAAPNSHLLDSTLPFIKGFTLLYWATATWWIPMLLGLSLWRYVYHLVPLTYSPLYWSAVFPLAMYTTATLRLAQVLHLPFLETVPRVFMGLALITWLLAFVGWFLTVGTRVLGLIRHQVSS